MADWFARGFGSAVEDIRNKLIEEGWFGRKTVEPRSQADDAGWSRGGHPGHSLQQKHDAGRDPSPDHDLER